MAEIHIAVDIFNFIDSRGEIGAKTAELVHQYEDKVFLQKILDYFNEVKLVMKTGVCEITYVHWKHIKPWVVNTYHLKRLDRVRFEAKHDTNLTYNQNYSFSNFRRRFYRQAKVSCDFLMRQVV